MSHPGSVDIIDFVLLTIYPVGGLFIIEILSRIISRVGKPVPSWLKLSIQGVTHGWICCGLYRFFAVFRKPRSYCWTTHNHCILFACTFCCIVLSSKTRKNESGKFDLLTKPAKHSSEFVLFSCATVTNYSFLTEFFCSELSKLHTSVIFWQSMFGTEWILTVITLKRHVCHISAVRTLFFQHNLVFGFFLIN